MSDEEYLLEAYQKNNGFFPVTNRTKSDAQLISEKDEGHFSTQSIEYEDDLVQDASFQAIAKTLYDFLNKSTKSQEMMNWENRHTQRYGRKPRPSEGVEMAKWLVRDYSMFNNNLPKMFIDYKKLKNAPLSMLETWYQGWLAFDELKNQPRHFGRALVGVGTDLTSFLGFNAIAKASAKGLSKVFFKAKMEDLIQRARNSRGAQYALYAGEGSAYMGGYGHMHEDVRSEATDTPYNPMTPALMAGLGAGAGVALPATVKATVGGVRNVKGYLSNLGNVTPDIDDMK